MAIYQIPNLPLIQDIETKIVLKQVAKAHRRLAELKGAVTSIPNTTILINTLSLQEAKDSSAVESIITTHDEIYKAELSFHASISVATKEVQSYASALIHGFELVKEHEMLTCNDIIEIYKKIKHNDGGFRSTPGTTLINDKTGEVVYQPPQSYDDIISYMQNLEKFINDNSISDLDPLIKMAIIHHQFESIHPFSDGNGRTGRIINILYLVLQDLLDLPVLYLSRYIIKNKGEYYRLLQSVRDNNDWESWILFILKGLEDTSKETVNLISEMKKIMMEYKVGIRSQLPKIYSQDLLNNLFKHPYTKIDFICEDLRVTRPTASSYLNKLVATGFLHKMKLGNDNYYLNKKLFELLTNAFHFDAEELQRQQVATIG